MPQFKELSEAKQKTIRSLLMPCKEFSWWKHAETLALYTNPKCDDCVTALNALHQQGLLTKETFNFVLQEGALNSDTIQDVTMLALRKPDGARHCVERLHKAHLLNVEKLNNDTKETRIIDGAYNLTRVMAAKNPFAMVQQLESPTSYGRDGDEYSSSSTPTHRR